MKKAIGPWRVWMGRSMAWAISSGPSLLGIELQHDPVPAAVGHHTDQAREAGDVLPEGIGGPVAAHTVNCQIGSRGLALEVLVKYEG